MEIRFLWLIPLLFIVCSCTKNKKTCNCEKDCGNRVDTVTTIKPIIVTPKNSWTEERLYAYSLGPNYKEIILDNCSCISKKAKNYILSKKFQYTKGKSLLNNKCFKSCLTPFQKKMLLFSFDIPDPCPDDHQCCPTNFNLHKLTTITLLNHRGNFSGKLSSFQHPESNNRFIYPMDLKLHSNVELDSIAIGPICGWKSKFKFTVSGLKKPFEVYFN